MTGLRGHQISQLLEADRLKVVLPIGRATARPRGLSWLRAHSHGIRFDDGDAWNAGQVQAVLGDGPVAIVGANTGGVWIVNPEFDAIPQTGVFPAVAVSTGWDIPDVKALAWGPDRQYVYVGCGLTGAFHVLQLRRLPGKLEVASQVQIPIPPSARGVRSIVCLSGGDRVVMGCEEGVWWSPIPSDPMDAPSYLWMSAPLTWDSPSSPITNGRVGSVAEGPDNTVLMATYQQFGTPPGLWLGTWQNGQLGFDRIAVGDTDRMRRTSVASCAGRRSTAYAMTTFDDETVGAVLKTTDGGRNWMAVSRPNDALQQPVPPGGHALTGHVLDYANTIAVCPTDENLLAVGWSSGPFFSEDGGQTWRLITDNENTKDLHADLHGLWFTGSQAAPKALFVAHDGGISFTDDLGATFDSRHDQHLTNLEIYPGCLGVSQGIPGLFGGGTQDNGNLWGVSDTTRPVVPLRQLDGGDGGPMRFLDNGLLVRTWNGQATVQGIPWDPTNTSFDGSRDAVVPLDGNPAGLMNVGVDPVRHPAHRNAAGQLMYACAAGGQIVYGLYANDDGTGAGFATIATLDSSVLSIASFDGSKIMVAVADGRILQLDSATGTTVDTDVSQIGLAGAGRLLWPTAGLAFGIVGGQVNRWDGSRWATTTGGPGAQTIAVEYAPPRRAGGRLFAATDFAVFVSRDLGDTWEDGSLGLPKRPHISDLRLAEQADGEQWLYLSSYGWGVWRARVDLVVEVVVPKEIDGEQVKILVGVVEGGGGLILTSHGPVPVDPDGPAFEAVSWAVVEALAARIGGDAGGQLHVMASDALHMIAAVHGAKALTALGPAGIHVIEH